MENEAKVIAKVLLGTSRDVNEVLHEEGIDSEWFEFYDGYDYLYDLVFQCEVCGKWYNVNKMNVMPIEGYQTLCNDCYSCIAK